MSAAVMEIPQNKDLESKALSIPQQAEALVISDQASYERAAEFLRDVVAAMKREICETFDPICARAFEAHKTATGARKRHLEPIERAEILIKQRIGVYELEQRRLAEELARKAQEEADRLAAEIVEAEIEAAEARGATVAEVRAIAETPFALPKLVASPVFQQAAGVSTRKSYRAEADLKTVIKAAAMGNYLAASVLKIDDSKLNALAKVQGPELSRQIPGVRVFEVASVATRRK